MLDLKRNGRWPFFGWLGSSVPAIPALRSSRRPSHTNTWVAGILASIREHRYALPQLSDRRLSIRLCGSSSVRLVPHHRCRILLDSASLEALLASAWALLPAPSSPILPATSHHSDSVPCLTFVSRGWVPSSFGPQLVLFPPLRIVSSTEPSIAPVWHHACLTIRRRETKA